MNLRKTIIAFTAIAALAGCVSFEFLPTTAQSGCDSALAGTWREDPSSREGSPVGERKASEWIVSRDCIIDLSRVDAADQDSNFDLSSFKVFDVYGKHYIAFEAYSSLRNYDKNGRFLGEWPKHRVLVLRYELQGDTLKLWTPDTEAARAITIPGVHLDKLGDQFRTDETEDNEFEMTLSMQFHFSGSPSDLEKLLRDRGDLLYSQPLMLLRRMPEKIAP